MKPKALILHAAGINRDNDVCQALSLAGADPHIVHVNQLKTEKKLFANFQMLIIPGGFSYGDALGAGKLFALDIASYFKEEASAFIASGKPVMGICNGFQTLVKSGLLPGGESGTQKSCTLTHNERNRFECRWVSLSLPKSSCIWTGGITRIVRCPVAHGEGRFLTADNAVLQNLRNRGQVALTYVQSNGAPAEGKYPDNPNGSIFDIAGICNEAGNILGLMPHPENNIFEGRNGSDGSGLLIFENGVRYAAQI